MMKNKPTDRSDRILESLFSAAREDPPPSPREGFADAVTRSIATMRANASADGRSDDRIGAWRRYAFVSVAAAVAACGVAFIAVEPLSPADVEMRVDAELLGNVLFF